MKEEQPTEADPEGNNIIKVAKSQKILLADISEVEEEEKVETED